MRTTLLLTLILSVGRVRAIRGLVQMPIQFTAPVTARQTNRLGEDAEEADPTTLGGHFEEADA